MYFYNFFLTWVFILLANSIRNTRSQGQDVLPVVYKPKLASTYASYYLTTMLNAPYSPATYASMWSYVYQFYGQQAIIDIESNQACRLNMNSCSRSSDCCSKVCICRKWSMMGAEVCARRCL